MTATNGEPKASHLKSNAEADQTSQARHKSVAQKRFSFREDALSKAYLARQGQRLKEGNEAT